MRVSYACMYGSAIFYTFSKYVCVTIGFVLIENFEDSIQD